MQDMSRCAAEDKFSQPRMTVAAHDEQVGVVFCHLLQEFRPYFNAIGGRLRALAVHAVTGESCADLGCRDIASANGFVLRIDPQDAYIVSLTQQGQRIEHGARTLAFAVPGNGDPLAQ